MIPRLNQLLYRYSEGTFSREHFQGNIFKGTFSSDTQPWKGHYKPRRRRQIGAVQNRQNDNSSLADATNDATVSEQLQRTRHGRAVRRPARYCLTMEGPALQQEGGCKGSHETKKRSREKVQESDHESSHEEMRAERKEP